MLQSKCLHIATGAPWYIGNRQFLEDLGVPSFADHIRALTESSDLKLVWEPLSLATWQIFAWIEG